MLVLVHSDTFYNDNEYFSNLNTTIFLTFVSMKVYTFSMRLSIQNIVSVVETLIVLSIITFI